MTKAYNDIIKIYSLILLLFSAGALSIIWVMSMCFTCFIGGDEYEITYFCKDNVLLNIDSLILCLVVLIVLSKKSLITNFSSKLNDGIYFKGYKKRLLWML